MSAKSFNPAMYTPVSASLTRTIGGQQEAIAASLDRLTLPYDEELEKYAKADDNNIQDLLDDLKALLASLAALNIAVPTMLLDPTQWVTLYSSGLLTSLTSAVTTNLTTETTGIDSTVETAMWNRSRQRINYDAARGTRRIMEEVAMRLPYAGMIADLMLEEDDKAVDRLAELNWQITEKQADLTYNMNRAKIKEAQDQGAMDAKLFEEQMRRGIEAYSKYDEINVERYFRYYDALIKRALDMAQAGVEFCLKAANGPDQITFQNYMEMSKALAAGQLQIGALVDNLMPSAQSI